MNNKTIFAAWLIGVGMAWANLAAAQEAFPTGRLTFANWRNVPTFA